MKDYIRSVLDVVAESPFVPLEAHAKKGVLAVEKLAEAMEAYCEGNYAILEERTEEIDKLEHEADKLKQKIRTGIPSSVRLPVNKKDLLSFLKQQDSIADYAQAAAYWMTLRPCKNIPDKIKEGFLELMGTSLKTARLYDELVGKLYKLLATSFSKEEIKETMTIIPEVEKLEHDVDVLETALLKEIFEHEDTIGGAGVCHLMGLVERIGGIADKSASAADRLRTMIYRR
ncbi:MAG: TIGR00153 family protein [Methanosarcina flavescens]|jgi:predicted phosphate transport protein (TIGR00153 family)|uniref:TIGR00153 family protein n=1 Tax=Methanosarcina flavescens TaxID=1715806 RepID=A0A660HNZ6_9EURY|nr:TIGR00153 family protein [Methanosarcina flavescens]AYK13998.1 TIGR00153 family protein [Methanosarcina flavescens]NLK32754.1 TIGR00153 family protein [Methanosarcina flavescens]